MLVKGYPIAVSFQNFYERYDLTRHKKTVRLRRRKYFTITDLQPKCVDILQNALECNAGYLSSAAAARRQFTLDYVPEQSDPPLYQLGVTKIWLSNAVHVALEAVLSTVMDHHATIIQKHWRRVMYGGAIAAYLLKRRMAAITLQRWWRYHSKPKYHQTETLLKIVRSKEHLQSRIVAQVEPK